MLSIVRIVVCLALLSLGLVLATPLPRAEASEPCCPITGINAKTGLVTAREAATGRTFQFTMTDRATLKGLRVGQQVYADFGTQQVSVDGIEPCCGIVQAKGRKTPGAAKIPAAKMPTVMGGTPCCSVAAVDQATGIVTLRDLKTGQTFQVAVKDAARLQSLKVGEQVERSIGTALK
jgi:Cu/Ag efflux protein CusF